MRDKYGKIIYVGKALSLKKRVQSYFTPAAFRKADPKLRGLIKSIADIDIVELSSENEAILHETKLIKDYKPKYNISFKDDKRHLLLTIDMTQPYPVFKLARLITNPKSIIFGPSTSSRELRAAQDYVERKFGLRKCTVGIPTKKHHKHCIDDIVRFCSAPCIGAISKEEYKNRAEKAVLLLSGKDPEGLKDLKENMLAAASGLDYEKAALYRDVRSMIFKIAKNRSIVRRSPAESRESAIKGINEIAKLAGIDKPPKIIETYDVSCISQKHAVASMVTAIDGIPHPALYRHYKIQTSGKTDDATMMREAVKRRTVRLLNENQTLPDLILVDGGAIQLAAAEDELKRLNVTTPVIGLAERYEEIYINKSGKITNIRLPGNSQALQVLQRIRDEAHRFALSHHRKIRDKLIKESILDEIPGVGPVTKARLLKKFGSVTRMSKATATELAETPGVGLKLAETIERILAQPRIAGNA
ncbi:MAG: GIY-YIG nuclease family protein [Lentisphaerae bacterium]|nr:GIY-YIG nuclease family protein [Lentisphaerota bacterium]